jgi:hypothetical protein
MRAKKNRRAGVEPISREQVERGAKIMGENSGFAKLLAEYDRRIAAGVPTAIYYFCGRWIVGDPIRDLHPI